MRVKHTMIEARSGPEHLDFARVDMTSRLFIHPNQIADCSRIRASFVQRLEHVDLSRSRIAMFAGIGVEGKKFHEIEVNTFFGNEVERQNAGLRRIGTANSQSFALKIF